MDITAAQTDSASKATAWLAQNLPVVETPADPAPVVPAVTPPVVPPATPPGQVVEKPGIAEAIRQDRETRAAAQATNQEVTKYRGELDAANKKIAALEATGSATDPFEFLRHRRLSKEQQALWGQAFLYDLKPEVAPQEFRLELYKAEQARKEQERAEADEKAQAERSVAQQRAQLDHYADELVQHVQSSAGSNPESEMWFSEEGPDGQLQLNHRVYAQSLLATADNIARIAQKTGKQADLSPANIAKTLEAEVSKRMQRRDAKRASGAQGDKKQVVPAVPAQGGTQATNTTTISAEGLRGGAPLPKDMSDEARRARAAAVMSGTR